jgi:hypothetical protein
MALIETQQTKASVKINHVPTDVDVQTLFNNGSFNPGEIIVTPDEDVNLACLRTEVIYSASDSTKNTLNGTVYSSGIVGGIVVNVDLSKYDKLFWVCCTNSTLGRYQVSNILDKSHTNNEGRWSSTTLYQETPIRMGITVTNTSLEILNNYSGSRLIYLAGILKTPAMIYTGGEINPGSGISLVGNTISMDDSKLADSDKKK